jgi:Kae1-associated kinase Bud32
MKLIQQGAEAKLYRDGGELVKDRVRKGYRLPELDARIRKLRTRGEARLLDTAARAGLNVPRVLRAEDSILRMEFIDGRRVKDALNVVSEAERREICELMGGTAGKMHSIGIVHGDMTTSNMIITERPLGSMEGCGRKKDIKLYLIDFGLGKMSRKVEDQAVDLYLLYEALKAAHFEYLNRSWQYILKSYDANYKDAKAAIQRFKVIEKRRRYKGG